MSRSEIHSTAVIDPGAEIGAGCVIGPYCIVGPSVVVGANCVLDHHVSLSGPSKIGSGNRFFPFTSIGHRSQDLKYRSEPTHLVVGDDNTFREFVTVNRGTAPNASTEIGSRGNFLAYSHVAHDCKVGDGVIFSNNGTIAGHVEVGEGAVLGGLSAVHQFCRIGKHAITGGCSKIVQDVPPFMIADGNPACVRSFNKVGLERNGFDEEQIRQIKEAYRIIYRSKLNLHQAVAQIRATGLASPEIECLIEFITNSARGIVK